MTSSPRVAEDAAAPDRGPGFGPVLHNRNFMLIWLAQGLSQAAYHAINFALVVLVETITRSSTAVSFMILAFSLPAVLFSGLAGVLVDRSGKRQVMVITTGLRVLVLASFIVMGSDWPWPVVLTWLYVATFLFSTFSQFFGPAEGALIPTLVGKRLSIPANALFNLTFFASQLLGFAVVGPLLAKVLGLSAVFQVATALYVVCTILVWLLPRDQRAWVAPPLQTRHLLASVWHDLVEGIRLIWRDNLLVKAIAYLSLASSAFLMLGVLGPAFVTRVLGIPAEELGFILAPAGLGILAGIVLVNRFAHGGNRERMIDLGILTSGGATLVFALVKPAFDAIAGLGGNRAPVELVVAAIMLVAAVLGASNAFIIVPSQTILQERSPDHMRARVYATFYTVSSAAALGPVLFAGALSDLLNVLVVLVMIGLVLLLIGGLSLRRGSGARG